MFVQLQDSVPSKLDQGRPPSLSCLWKSVVCLSIACAITAIILGVLALKRRPDLTRSDINFGLGKVISNAQFLKLSCADTVLVETNFKGDIIPGSSSLFITCAAGYQAISGHCGAQANKMDDPNAPPILGDVSSTFRQTKQNNQYPWVCFFREYTAPLPPGYAWRFFWGSALCTKVVPVVQ
jgi:hypothetical protein